MNKKSAKKEKYVHKSLSENAYNMAKGLYEVGTIDAETMRELEAKYFLREEDLLSKGKNPKSGAKKAVKFK